MKVAVIGCGYVGLISAVGLSSKGHQVTAIDINKERVIQLQSGRVPFHEPGVEQLLKSSLRRQRITFTDSISSISSSDIILVCVPTPPQNDGTIDLSTLVNVCNKIKLTLSELPKETTVVIRSTVIPGTTNTVVAPIFKSRRKKGGQVAVAVNPEFLREGSALDDFLHSDRIVIGTYSEKARKALTILYSKFTSPLIYTTPANAELAKYTSNSFLATLISFSNEIAKICEHTPGTDIEEVLSILHLDRRFYSSKKTKPGILSYLKAGCGFGGSCLPKDLSALISYAKAAGTDTPLLQTVAEVNVKQPVRVVELTENILGTLSNRWVAVLGAAFKGGTDDLRESPGLRIIDELLARNAKVTLYDPLVKEAALEQYRQKGVLLASNLVGAIKEVEACIIATNSEEFLELIKVQPTSSRKTKVIVDGRRIFDKANGVSKHRYYAVGLNRSGNTHIRSQNRQRSTKKQPKQPVNGIV